MKHLILSLLPLISLGFFYGIDLKAQNSIQSYPESILPPATVVHPMEVKVDWRPQMRNTSSIPEHATEDALRYRAAKAEANRLARIHANDPALPRRTSAASSPTLYQGFAGNVRDVGNPNDNDIAVSQAGYKVSVVNLDITAYGPNNGELFSMSLEAFTPGIGTNQKFDPRIDYDPIRKRFIFTCLNGFNPNSSKVIVAFSSKEDPRKEWYVYGLAGNFDLLSGADVWSDFPKTGLNESEFFVTTNLFDAMGDAQGTGIYQIDLDDAFAGDSLQYKPHSLQGTVSLTPVKGGEGPKGTFLYFIDNVSEGGDRNIFLHKINNTIDQGGQFEPVVSLVSDLVYNLSPNARQQNSVIRLITGDCRIHGAYHIDNRIYFAFNARVNFRPGVYFGVIKISPIITFSTVHGQYIGSPDYDIAYPNLTYGGCESQTGDFSSLMVFDFSSANEFPGNAVMHIDTLEEVSEPTICAIGDSSLGRLLADSTWRWGDYTGISSPMPGQVWVAGYDVNSTGRNQTYISQLFNEACTLYPLPVETPEEQEIQLNLYPNPSLGMVNISFEVNRTGIYQARIYDLQGRMVHQVMEGSLQRGEAKISFSTEPLSSGTYILHVMKDQEISLSKKFQVY